MSSSFRYDLNTGYPDIAAMPNGALAEITAEIIASGRGLQYAGFLEGTPATREAVARFISSTLDSRVSPAELMITAGAISATDIVARALTQPGDVVIVEDPTFFFIINVLRRINVEVVPISMTADGIDLNLLQQALDHFGSRVRMLYTIPSFHNPTGICASSETRGHLIELAREYDFTLVEDETYHQLYFDEPPPPMLKQYDSDGHAIALGSFSKLIAPSLRQGWIWATPEQIQQIKPYKSDAATSLLTSEILVEYLTNENIEAQISHLRRFYGQRRTHMDNALSLHMPEDVIWDSPGGGFFTWVKLPEHVTATQLRKLTQAQGVDFMPGHLCSADSLPDRYMRLCFAMIPEAEIEQGVKVIGQCLQGMA